MDKSVVKSKTFWMAIIMTLLSLWPKTKEVVTPELFNMAWGFLIVVLRLVTKDKVKLLP